MIFAGLLALLLAAAQGQETPPDPPPPASLAARDVAAWVEAHLDAQDWRVLAINPHGVLLASPGGVKLRADGFAEADLRHEMFAPIELGNGQMRSDLEHWLVNCQDRRHALMRMSLYTHNNLKDEFASRGTEEPKWLETANDDEAAQAVEAMCQAVEGKTPPAAHKPPEHP